MDSQSLQGNSLEWPDCESEQIRVMLVGTFHMDNPGLDEANVDAADVLSECRQAELRKLVNRLADWDPQRIAVERPYTQYDEVNARYQEYRSGERSFDREETFPAPHPERTEPTTECRSEVVQVGFRLAAQLGHTFIATIDELPDETRYDPDPFKERDFDSTRKTTVAVRDPEVIERKGNERLKELTISEYLAWVNSEQRLRDNHDLMFDRGIRGADARFGSPIALAFWYDRNIRMVHHLWRSVASKDTRVLLLVGSGHVRVLRHLLNESPMFCPVSPLPYLPDVDPDC